jgi:hypothetical protein
VTVYGRLPIVCVVLSLCSPAAAHASTSPARIKRREFAVKQRRERLAPLGIALEKAYQLWGVEPCAGGYRVELTMLPPEMLGHSSWLEPAGSLGPYTRVGRSGGLLCPPARPSP